MYQWFGYWWLDDDGDDDMPVANGKTARRPLNQVFNFSVKFNAVERVGVKFST